MNVAAPRAQLRLGILALDGCMLSSVAGPIDTLRVAQALAEIKDPVNAPRFEGRVVSARGARSVRTASGLVLDGIDPTAEDLDVLLVPGIEHRQPRELMAKVALFEPEMALLRRLALRGMRIGATCSGTFMLAATGLLDGKRATTSWWLAGAFQKLFPDVRLEADKMVVEDTGMFTAGATTAVLSLVTRLIGETGGESLAQQTCRMLALDAERQSQAPYVSLALQEKPRTSLTERAEKLLQRELHRDISVTRLAEHCGTSERSLLRHFRAHYGESPLAYIQRLRVERAKALLETTHLSFEEIMERCGYADTSSFRKLFKRATSLTPADYRERFRLRAR